MKRTLIIVALLAISVTGTTFHIVLGPPPGTKPVFRFWNRQTGAHFYTMNEVEKLWLENKYAHVWASEGIAYYAWPDPNATPPEEVRP
jgi:hypothetical protein